MSVLPRSALLLVLVAWGALGCQSPGARRIVGPDGSAMAHVHCGGDQGECFRLAGELCPTGYEMKPVLTGNDGNFLVRCRAGGAVVAAAPACVTAPSTSAPVVATSAPRHASRGHGEGWPPATEPWPAAYPWPPPETSAVVQTPSPAAPGAELDLGY
jgi:hypothetical protein